jgi:hypothetical protein
VNIALLAATEHAFLPSQKPLIMLTELDDEQEVVPIGPLVQTLPLVRP